MWLIHQMEHCQQDEELGEVLLLWSCWNQQNSNISFNPQLRKLKACREKRIKFSKGFTIPSWAPTNQKVYMKLRSGCEHWSLHWTWILIADTNFFWKGEFKQSGFFFFTNNISLDLTFLNSFSIRYRRMKNSLGCWSTFSRELNELCSLLRSILCWKQKKTNQTEESEIIKKKRIAGVNP